jgi:hypothetical protein
MDLGTQTFGLAKKAGIALAASLPRPPPSLQTSTMKDSKRQPTTK